jgi:hypothetical protein
MAALIPSASATGSGTMTLAGPSTNSNQTITIPDATGTMMVSGNMPAFSAYSSYQAITNNSFNKMVCSNEVFDTANAFDSTTNYRFTPLVAGYYQINGHVALSAAIGICAVSIFKNGVNFYSGSSASLNTGYTQCNVSGIVYLNGSTDYVELYCFQNSGGTINTITASGPYNYFNGSMVRTA